MKLYVHVRQKNRTVPNLNRSKAIPKNQSNNSQKKRKMKCFSLLLVIVLLSSPTLLSQEDLSEYEKRLEKIFEQIKDLQQRIEEEEKKESTALSRLDRIGFKKRLIRKEISLTNIQLEKTNRELRSIRQRIPPLKSKLKKEQQSIEKILVTVYKFGKFNFLEFMLQSKDFKTLLAESKNLTLLAQYQDKIISDYLDTLAQLTAAEEKQKRKTQELSQLIQKARQKRKELEEEERKNRNLIREIEKNKKAHTQTIVELKERAEQLEILMKKLVKEGMVFPFPFIPLYEKKGQLPWPIEGNIISRFGRQRHPVFKTVTIRNGIEISPRGSEMIIKSIHSGKVVYADYFKGYGNLIIIDHGITYYSLYGYCEDFLVEKGDLINVEQPIAVVGDFGSLKGISLYFEIRFKRKPLNPLQWLKRR
jgi:septal ring factor EnvC (AmiA/AmiB activator)